MARENSDWGYARIRDELKKLGHKVVRTRIANTLHQAVIPPSPERPTSWREFLRSHAGDIAAMDFFTTEVWTTRGLATHYTLFAIEHGSRRIHVAGTTINPYESFMTQVARNLTGCEDGFLEGIRYLILDPDKKFTRRSKRILKAAGVKVFDTSYQAPNMNAFAEPWVLSVKSECLNRMILFGEDSLRRTLKGRGAHFHTERPHQELGNDLIEAPETTTPPGACIVEH